MPRRIVSDQEHDQHGALAFARGVHAHGHGEAAEEQDEGHGRAERSVQAVAAGSKAGVVQRAIDDVCREQAAEEEHLGGEKNPHAEIAGVVLLLEILELVVQRGAARAGMAAERGWRRRQTWACSSSA